MKYILIIVAALLNIFMGNHAQAAKSDVWVPNPVMQLKCVVLRIYSLSEVGTLIQHDQIETLGADGNPTTIRPNASTFFLEPRRGVIMGDLSNVTSDKIEISNIRSGTKGLTLSMTDSGKSSYLWLDTTRTDFSGDKMAAQTILWVDIPFIYTGLCN